MGHFPCQRLVTQSDGANRVQTLTLFDPIRGNKRKFRFTLISSFQPPSHRLATISCAFSLTLLMALAGCATRPESISASFVSHEKFMGQSCTQLTDSLAEARAKLADFSRQQDSKANLDAATVFFVLIPASKLSGDHAGDVAKSKGEVEAIETAQVKSGCKALPSG